MWPLSRIDLDTLEERSRPDRWGRGDPDRDRRVFFDSERGLYFKIWGPLHEDHRRVHLGLTQVVVADKAMFGFATAFFDAATAPAFVEDIVDEYGRCRGYVTRAGESLRSMHIPQFAPFIEAVKEATRRTQFAHTDVCYNNLILVDEQVSFIDFDTVFTHLPLIDVEFETEFGCLRPHVYDSYRAFVVDEVERLRGGGARAAAASA